MPAKTNDWITRITEEVIHRVPDLGAKDKEHLREGLIRNAFTKIMLHSQANAYDTSWDSILVDCVVTLYNYLGEEGSISRAAGGVSDTYACSNVLATLLASSIPHYIRPTGYVYSKTRFDYPTD